MIPIRADFHHTISTVVTTTLLILPLRSQLIQVSTVFIWLTATTWPRTCSLTDNKISRAQFGTTPISTTVCSEILTLNTQEDLFYPPSPPPPTFPMVADKPKKHIISSISLKNLSFLAIILHLWVSHKFWLWFFLPFPERPSAKIAHSQLCANQNFEKPFGISTYALSKSCIMVNMIRSRPNWEPNFFSQRLDWRKFKQ